MRQLELGIPETLLDAHAASTGNSEEFALPARATQLTWQTSFGTAPASITLQLQVSLDDSVWSTIDTSTSTTAESKTINTSAIFIRARINAVSGGSAITVKLIAKAVSIIDTDTPTFGDTTITGDLSVAGNLSVTGTINEFTFPSDGTDGQFLQTNGAGLLSFVDLPPGLPPSTGANKILYDDGVTQSWSASPKFNEVGGTPNFAISTDTDGFLTFISDTYINFQAGGAVAFSTGGIPDQLLIGDGNDQVIVAGSAAALTIRTQNVTGSDNTSTINIVGGSSEDGSAGNISLTAGNQSTITGASLAIFAGSSDDANVGGNFTGIAGDGIIGGNVILGAGIGTGGLGGNLTLNAGQSDIGGGYISINAGYGISGNANGGECGLSSGAGSGTGTGGNLTLTSGAGGSGVAGANITLYGGDTGDPKNAGAVLLSGGLGIDDVTSGSGNIVLAAGGNATNDSQGGNVYLNGGSSINGNAGQVEISGGTSTGTGQSGRIHLISGQSNASNPSGDVLIETYAALTTHNVGTINITGGNSADGNAGSINLTAGTASGSGSSGQININSVSYFASYQVRIKASDSLGTGSSLQLLAGGTLTSSGENGGDVTVEAGYGLGSSTGGNINLTAGGSDTGSAGTINVSGNMISNGTITANDFILTGSSLKSDTTNVHTGSIQVYDVDGAAYRDFLTWTNGNTPAVVMNPPTGGTLSVDANAFKSSGVAGVDASIIIPLVGTITVSKGIITGFA